MTYFVELRSDLSHFPCGRFNPIEEDGSIFWRHPDGREGAVSVESAEDSTGYLVDL